MLSRTDLETRIASFPFWHYAFDLGDGVRTATTHPGHQDWHEARKRIILSLVEQRFGPDLAGRHCLDSACNAGFWSFALAERGAASVRGIDASADFIAQAQLVQSVLSRRNPALGRPRFERRDFFDLPEEPERYDLILFLGLMYHLTDPLGAARKLYRMSRGMVVVDSSLSPLPGAVLEIGDASKYIFCGAGEFAFVPTIAALIAILRQAGFSKVTRWTPETSTTIPYAELEPMLRPLAKWTQSDGAVLPYAQGSLRGLVVAEK